MIIRVDTLGNLITDTAYYLGKESQTLLHDIKGIDFQSDDPFGYRYIVENKKMQLSEVYLCHIARRLDTDNNMRLLTLIELLTTTNSFSDFLRDHDISFDKSCQNGVELLYHGKVIDWREKRNIGYNPARFEMRLRKDFCVNGFQFLYDMVNSTQPNFNLYSCAPEFLQDLDLLLDAGLVNDFRSISHTFIALCRLPIGKIVFDGNENDENFEVRYIHSSLRFIWEYCFPKFKKGHNCILRGLDDYTVQVEKWIPEEKIEHFV